MAAYLIGQGCPPPGGDPNKPEVVNPPASAVVTTSKAYVSVKVLTGQTYEVWLTLQGQAARQVTSQFRFAATFSGTKEIHHAQLAVPIGTHQVRVTQHVSGGSSVQSLVRTFSRAEGATRELGPIDDAGGVVVGTALQGALRRAAGSTWLLFGETRLSDATVHPAAQASSADTNAADGIDLTYYGEPGAIQSVLALAPADPGENDEEGALLTASFERGGDVYAYYVRIDADATPLVQGIGLARAVGGVPPFTRFSFPGAQPPGGGHFDDDDSLFQADELPLVRGALLSGNDVLLLGQRGGASGLPQDAEVVLVKAPLSSVEDRATYQFWTEVGGVRAWRAASSGPVPLFKNASPPSLHWNPQIGRFLAVSTQEYGEILPYTGSVSRGAIQLRVADDPVGPWSAPIAVWGLPPVAAGAMGMALGAMQLPGFESGSLLYLAATEASDPLLPTKVQLFEVDLNDLALPVGPVPPQITTLTGNTGDNPTTVRGWATPGDTVTLVVNGANQASLTAGAGGEFAIPAILLDGANTVHAFATRSSQTSAPSNAITLTYQNDDNHSQTGTITQNTVWTPGTGEPYVVDGPLTVAGGVTLTLQPGVVVEVAGAFGIDVAGTLTVRGTASAPVSFTSGQTSPARGNWLGIDIEASSVGSTIDHAVIEYAVRGVEIVHPASATITRSTIREFTEDGIRLTRGSLGPLVNSSSFVGNVVDNSGGTAQGNGIRIDNGSGITTGATIEGNLVRGASNGIWLQKTSPDVLANTIELNTDGIEIKWGSDANVSANEIRLNGRGIAFIGSSGSTVGVPLPVLRDNRIHSNTSWNLDTGDDWDGSDAYSIDAKENFWGTLDPEDIALTIQDRAEGPSSAPTVNFLPFQNQHGVIVPQGTVLGGQLAGDLTLTAGATYEVAGALTVPPGLTLTVREGATLRFARNSALVVDGTLLVQGTDTSKVILTSAAGVPARGDWYGVDLQPTTTGAVIEHAIIEYVARGVEIAGPASPTVRDTRIREFSENGIRVNYEDVTAAGGTFADNVIDNTAGIRQGEGIHLAEAGAVTVEGNEIRGADRGIWMRGTSPQVLENTIEQNNSGIVIRWASTAVLTGNTITNNQRGIVLEASCCSGVPLVTIHDNDIHGNPTFNLETVSSWPNAQSTVIDAANNYWGSTDPAQIAITIYDRADHGTRPTVDFTPFLDANGDLIGAGNLLSGAIPTTTLDVNGQYEVAGVLLVPAGETLTIPDGVTIRFATDSSLVVNGTLLVQGEAGNPARFTALSAPPARGVWHGIDIGSNGVGTTIDHAVIEYARRGIEIFEPASAVIGPGTVIREFSEFGIRGEDGVSVNVDGAVIDNTGGSRVGDGIHFEDVTGTVTIQNSQVRGANQGVLLQETSAQLIGNLVEQNNDGVVIYWTSTPLLAANEIRGNQRGVVLNGSPTAGAPNPTITDNRIHANSVRQLAAGPTWPAPDATVIDAENNYWGDLDPGVIGAGVLDRTDDSRLPSVDFAPFDDELGVPVSGSELFLLGPIDDSAPLSADTTYDVVGTLIVLAGRSLTIPSGVTLRMYGGTAVLALGTLETLGTPASRVILRGINADPGHWKGIEIRDPSGSSALQHTTVEYATTAVHVVGVPAAVANGVIRHFADTGILLSDGANGTIQGTLIENQVQSGTGIYVDGSDATIDGNNTIRNTATGIVAFGESTLAIEGNLITANAAGIWLKGTGASGGNPVATIQGNDLSGNINAGDSVETALRTSGFFAGEGVVIDASENWWGHTTPAAIQSIISHQGDDIVPVDYSNFLDGPGGTPVQGTDNLFTYLLGGVHASTQRFAPTVGESASVRFTLATAATVIVTFYLETDDTHLAPVRTIVQSLSAGSQSVAWDGREQAGAFVEDEAYAYVVQAVSGGLTSLYDPPRPAGPALTAGVVPSTYAPFRNDFFKLTYTITGGPARLDVIATPLGGAAFPIFEGKPRTNGTYAFLYDGRDLNGNIVITPINFLFDRPVKMKRNVILVERTAPTITGTGAAPNVEVKSDPYLVYHSYAQISEIVYRLDQDAYVTVKLLRPGTSDPANPANVVATLVAGELQPARDTAQQPIDYALTWTGSDAATPNSIVSAAEGPFTFAIQATSTLDPARTTLYRGVLQVRR